MKPLSTLLRTIMLSSSALISTTTQAETTPNIIGYDIFNTTPSGFGGWVHDYTERASNANGGLVNYEGGTGTLADGIFGISTSSTQLFSINNNTSITVFLDDYYLLESISLFGGATNNQISGNIAIASFSTELESASLTSLSFGEVSTASQAVNDRFILSNTSAFKDQRVNQFTISNIGTTGLGHFSDYYSITEIQVSSLMEDTPTTSLQMASINFESAQVSVVPEPATYALMLGGLGLIGFMAHRRRKPL